MRRTQGAEVKTGPGEGMARPIHRRAYAKINLALSVGPPIASPSPHAGMHPIVSWMHCIDLADEIEIRPSEEGADDSDCRITWASDALLAPGVTPPVWSSESDLAGRARRILERDVGRPLPAAIRVVKRIPAGAGLGGGSADAAAALAALNEAFGLGLSVERLGALAAELGSDVPFFVDEGDEPARPGLASGLGEVVQRLSRRGDVLVLVALPVSCATAAVYSAYDEMDPRPLRPERVRALVSRRLWTGSPLFNDLAEAAERVEPRLREFRERCEALVHRPVHITGSGSALFILATGEADAHEMQRRIAGEVPEAEARVTRLA